jgi:hypothetical protein
MLLDRTRILSRRLPTLGTLFGAVLALSALPVGCGASTASSEGSADEPGARDDDPGGDGRGGASTADAGADPRGADATVERDASHDATAADGNDGAGDARADDDGARGDDAGSGDADTEPVDASPPAWPFAPGPCSPTKPGVLVGPGVVDPETLCERRGSQASPVVIRFGDTAYGSIARVDATNRFPDSDNFSIALNPRTAEVVRVTVEGVSGDFEPNVAMSINGRQLIYYLSPSTSNRRRASRELFLPPGGFALDLSVSDARARDEASYGRGAGATYTLRVDRVQKTPIPLGDQADRMETFTDDENVLVYGITLPAFKGTLRAESRATGRSDGVANSDVNTLMWLWRPGTSEVPANDAYSFTRQNSIIRLDHDPERTTPGPYWLVVDHDASSLSYAFQLLYTFAGPPSNERCDAPLDATPTGSSPRILEGDTRLARNDYALSPENTTGCRTMFSSSYALGGRDVVYSVNVPPRTVLTAELTPEDDDAALWISDRCAASPTFACVAFSDASSSRTGKEKVTFTNPDAAPRTVYLHVDGRREDAGSPFRLVTSFAAANPAPDNDRCASATRVNLTSGPTTLVGSTESARDDLAPAGGTGFGCGTRPFRGRDVSYAMTIPAGRRLRASLVPTGPTWNAALWLSSTCDGGSCLAAVDRSTSGEDLSYWNRSSSDLPVLLHVDALDATGGPFRLVVRHDGPFGRDVCPGVPASPTAAFVASTQADANDYEPPASAASLACRSALSGAPWSGLDHVYAFEVPPQKTLKVDVKSPTSRDGQPTDMFKVLLATSCGDAQALASTCVSAGERFASYRNASDAPRTVYLLVDQTEDAPKGSYNVIPTLE